MCARGDLRILVHPGWRAWTAMQARSEQQPHSHNLAQSPCSKRPNPTQDLTCSGQLSYLGNSWRKDVSFAGYGVPLQVRLSDSTQAHVEESAQCLGVCLAFAVRRLTRAGCPPPCPQQADISAGKMIFNVEGVDPARRARLIHMLDIDIYQRLTTMSDGQRRRVQICMGLLKLYDVGARGGGAEGGRGARLIVSPVDAIGCCVGPKRAPPGQ